MSAVLRIGTWNVEYADNPDTNARRKSVMENCPADIWVLTETHDDLTPGGEFRAVHSDQRPLYGRRVQPRSRWVSVWTRLPIISRVRLPCSDQERTTVALIDSPLGPLCVYGTVLPWHSDTGRYGQRPYAPNWSEHHRVIPRQAAEWEALRQLIPQAQLCVAGDLNTDMDTGAAYGTKRGINMLRDGLNEVGLYCATHPSILQGGWLERAPIDHIALPLVWKKRVSLVSAWEGRVGSPRLSDHSGMVVAISA